MMRTSRSSGCCGLVEIYNLDDMEAAYFGGKRREANTIPFVLTGHRGGIAIATTSAHGNYAESVLHLKAHGFHPVLVTPNPKTDNKVTLWVRDLSEGKLPVKLERKPWWLSRAWHFCGYARRLFRRNNQSGHGPHVDNAVLGDNEE